MNTDYFYKMCLNLGVVDQLIKKGFMDNPSTISTLGLSYVQETPEVEEDFVEKYRKKFSKTNIGISGKIGDYHGIKKKFQKFFKKYSYKEEDILKAVDRYIQDNRRNPIYIMEAHYFIEKDNISKLASYCEDMESFSEHKYAFHE